MIDGHCHLDKSLGTPEKALHFLYQEANRSGIKGILLLNLPELAFNNTEVLKLSQDYEGFFNVFPGINPRTKGCSYKLEQLKKCGAKGIKLHPRLHNYKIECKECVETLRKAGDLAMPVLIDCFPDGKNISLDNLPGSFGRVAELLGKTRIAIGHAGGHHILDAMMVAKSFENIFLDLSFTLLYYRNSPLTKNIAYALHNLKFKKIFWGTDYPDRSYSTSVRSSLAELEEMKIPEEGMSALLWENVISFLEGNSEQ